MIIIVDNREAVSSAYTSMFQRAGVSSVPFKQQDFSDWFDCVSESELQSVEAILLGETPDRHCLPGRIKNRTRAALIALNDEPSLDQTLQLFAAGVDDVVRKPIHVRELLVRIEIIRRRIEPSEKPAGTICVFPDGRPPLINGAPLELPRRELRILEYMTRNKNKRVTKTQLFNAIYGMFNDETDETSIESHISKLRSKLKQRLGFDPIDSKRYLGYCLTVD